ncbi:MAG: hypothetical protein VB120_00865 [Lachnospiraceae bacterium]|nr:hypothetical protein [Lachnospiraceae bacterium]
MKLVLDRFKTKKTRLKEYIECSRIYFLDIICSQQDCFQKDFYIHSVESSISDAYENFIELGCENILFEKSLDILDFEHIKRFMKLMAMYHTIRFSKTKRVEESSMREFLFLVYELNDREKRMYELMYDVWNDYRNQFNLLFSKAFLKYIIGINEVTPFMLAFIENFCYNSYSRFMASFTRYITVSDRLKKLIRPVV